MKYTQREWDRVVGYGKVPKEYTKQHHLVHMINDSYYYDGKEGQIKRVVAETNPIKSQENP